MDRRRMDAEGGRVVHRDRRAGKIAVVMAVQNILVAACLLVTLYVYWGAEKTTFDSGEDTVHIQFDAIGDTTGSMALEFNTISSSYMMGFADKKIYINCTGPYILYMDVCYTSIGGKQASGTLELQVVGKHPVMNFTLQASYEVCGWHQSIVYLREQEAASLYLRSTEQFKIKNMTMGLSFLLGKCEY